MKKRDLKLLKLNKKSIHFFRDSVRGGAIPKTRLNCKPPDHNTKWDSCPQCT